MHSHSQRSKDTMLYYPYCHTNNIASLTFCSTERHHFQRCAFAVNVIVNIIAIISWRLPITVSPVEFVLGTAKLIPRGALTFKASNYIICFDQNIWNKTDIWFCHVCHDLHLTLTSKFMISCALLYFNPVNGVCNFYYAYTQACLCKHADTAFHKRLKWQKRTYVTATKHTLWQAKTNGIKWVSSTRFYISYICILR